MNNFTPTMTFKHPLERFETKLEQNQDMAKCKPLHSTCFIGKTAEIR